MPKFDVLSLCIELPPARIHFPIHAVSFAQYPIERNELSCRLLANRLERERLTLYRL